MRQTCKKYLQVAPFAVVVVFMLAQAFAAALSGTNVAAPIKPFDTADTYPTHEARYGKGGYVQQPTTTARNAIPAFRRMTGMYVYVADQDKEYQLYNGTSNADWRERPAGSGHGIKNSAGSIMPTRTYLRYSSPFQVTDDAGANETRVSVFDATTSARGLMPVATRRQLPINGETQQYHFAQNYTTTPDAYGLVVEKTNNNAHVGKQAFNAGVFYAIKGSTVLGTNDGSGLSVGSADIGLGITAVKQNILTTPIEGEVDGLYIHQRNGGSQSDGAGILIDVGLRDTGDNTPGKYGGFNALIEGISHQLTADGTPEKSINVQLGVINKLNHDGFGVVATATKGNSQSGVLIQEGTTASDVWSNAVEFSGDFTDGINMTGATFTGKALKINATNYFDVNGSRLSRTNSSVVGGATLTAIKSTNTLSSSSSSNSGYIVGQSNTAEANLTGTATSPTEVRPLVNEGYNTGTVKLDSLTGTLSTGGTTSTGGIGNFYIYKAEPYSPGAGVIDNIYGYYADVSGYSATNRMAFYSVGTALSSFGGVVESRSGGFKFPDGTTQTTATTGIPSIPGHGWEWLTNNGSDALWATIGHWQTTGLTSDDHTQYALLAGRASGQTLIGGTAADNDLTLQGTSGNAASAGQGNIIFKTGNNGGTVAGTVDYNGRWGIGGSHVPQAVLDITSDSNGASVRMPFGGGIPRTDYYKAGTSISSPTAVPNGTLNALNVALFHDGTSYKTTGYTAFVVNGSVATNSVPTDYQILTGSSSATERLRIKSDGLTYFSNSAGLPSGNMYSNTSTTITVASSGTWYEVDTGASPDFTAGQLTGVTFSDHYLVAPVAGKYLVNATVSFGTATASDEIALSVAVNGTAQASCHGHATVVNATTTVPSSCTTILSLAANDQVSLTVQNHTAARDITLSHANMSLLHVAAQ